MSKAYFELIFYLVLQYKLWHNNVISGSSKILKEIVYRTEEFIEMKKIRVAVGTWNVNGGKQLRLPSCKDQVM